MAKFKPYRKGQLHLLPASLEDYVPEGHLARLVYEVVEELDTTEIEEKYSDLGQHTYSPKILLKLLFYGYATGVRSGRKIGARCESDTAYMYLAEQYRLDFRTLNDFRKEHLKEIEGFFIDMVRICQGLGMGKVGQIHIDGSKLRANAAARRSKQKESYACWLEAVEEEIRGILKEAEQTDQAEDRIHGQARGDELPEGLRSKEVLRAKIKEVLAKFKGDRNEKINLTDVDSRFMKERAGVITPAYNCQLAVEQGQLIVGADVVVEENDRKQLVSMVEQTETVTAQGVEEVIADSGYASYDNYAFLSSEGKRGYIPDQYFNKVQKGEYLHPQHRYHKENFQYNEEQDIYICPEGKVLPFYKERDSERGVIKRRQWIYKGKDCASCLVRTQCTKMAARTISREKREELQEAMRERLSSAEGKAKYKRRLYTVEPVFGHLKHNLGYRRFLLRTLEKVRGEFKMMCIGYNLRKLFGYRMAMAKG